MYLKIALATALLLLATGGMEHGQMHLHDGVVPHVHENGVLHAH